MQNGGNRHTTVLVYLNDVEEGGETVFPMLPPAPGQEAAGLSPCAAEHLAVKPKKGTGTCDWSETGGHCVVLHASVTKLLAVGLELLPQRPTTALSAAAATPCSSDVQEPDA